MTKRMLTMTMATLAMSASVAMAGTKYQASLVNAGATDPPANPTMASGKVSLKDTGDIKAKVKGVTDAGGSPAASSTVYDDLGLLDGTEYVVILKLNFTALGVDVEIPVPMDLNNGGGKGAVSLGALTLLIPPGTGRSLEATGGEVWGPLGVANVAACQADLALGYALLSSACKGGTRVGVAGVDVP